jgi:hypothetical protein
MEVTGVNQGKIDGSCVQKGRENTILVEGFKRLPLPKIEVTRAGVGEGRIGIGSDLLALVTEDAPLGGCTVHGLPCFRPDDASGVAALLRARGLLR